MTFHSIDDKGWRQMPLGSFGMGRTRSILPTDYPDEEFELWSIPSFPTGRPEVASGATIGSNKLLVEPGDVLLSKINPRINRVWKVGPKGTRRQIASTEWIVFRPPQQECDPDYLVWVLREPSFRKRLCADVSGVGGSLTRARPEIVRDIEVLIAPRDEQRGIAGRLDDIMDRSLKIRMQLEGALKDCRDFFESSLMDCVTAGNQLKARPDLLESGVAASMPFGWSLERLEDLVTDGPRNGYSPPSNPNAMGTLTLRLSATTSGRIILNDQTTKRIEEQILEDSRLWLVAGDLLVQRSNTIEYVGTAAVYDGPDKTFVYPDLMSRMRFEERVVGEWVACLLNSRFGRQWVRNVAKGTAGNMPKINGSSLKRMWVPVPPLDTMKSLVHRALDSRFRMESVCDRIRHQISTVEALEESVLRSTLSSNALTSSR